MGPAYLELQALRACAPPGRLCPVGWSFLFSSVTIDSVFLRESDLLRLAQYVAEPKVGFPGTDPHSGGQNEVYIRTFVGIQPALIHSFPSSSAG